MELQIPKPKYVILSLGKENTVQLRKVQVPDKILNNPTGDKEESPVTSKFITSLLKIDQKNVILMKPCDAKANPLSRMKQLEQDGECKFLLKSGEKYLKADNTETCEHVSECKQNLQWDRKLVTLSAKSKEAIQRQAGKLKLAEKSARRDRKKFNNFRCLECNLNFDTSNRLFVHKRTTHRKPLRSDDHTCSYCEKLFKSFTALQKHENKHKGVVFPCSICSKQLSTKHQLGVHMRYHTGEYTHKCEECGKKYFNNKAYRQHMEAEHKGIRYPCEYCPSVLRSKRYWKDHMAKHIGKNLRPFKCDVCNKFYSSKSALNGHMKIHTGEKYNCDICGKKSTQRAAHVIHMRLHSGEKSYVCEVCGKGFIRKDMLTLHIRRVHELYQFPCAYCEDKFNTRYQLEVHLHDHEEVEKRFECQFCEQKFTNNNFLRTHINKVHIDNVADHEFGGKRGIKGLKTRRKTRDRQHLAVDPLGPSKPFKCQVCRMGFVHLPELKAHLRLHLKKTLRSNDDHEIHEDYAEELAEEVLEFDEEFVNSDSVVEISQCDVLVDELDELIQ